MCADATNNGFSGSFMLNSSTAPWLSDVTAAILAPSAAVNISMSRGRPRRLLSPWIVAAASGRRGSVKSTTWTAADPPAATTAYALPPDSNALTLVGAVSVIVPSSSLTAAVGRGGVSSVLDGGDPAGAVIVTEASADGLPIPSTALAVTLLVPAPSRTWMNHEPPA